MAERPDPNERIIRNRLAEAAADIKDAKDTDGGERHAAISRAREAMQAAEAASAKTLTADAT